jgi:hypothetical protein
MILKVGVTGTRNGMTVSQQNSVKNYLNTLKSSKYTDYELHHGDCVGVDVEVATMAHEIGYKTINHPPIKDELRAFHKSDTILEPKTYFARNRNIINNTDILFVVPKEESHQNSGGTWYTHDYAKKLDKSIVIFFPGGKIETKIKL